MPNSKGKSFLPLVLIGSILAGCALCLFFGSVGTALSVRSRRVPATPVISMPIPSAAALATTVEAASIPMTAETQSAPFTATVESPPMPTATETQALSPTPDVSSDPDSWRMMGDPDAPVVVEEFGDFQCPYCGQFHMDVEPKLREDYIATGKVRFIFRNFPVVDSFVAGGVESRDAALAALCAGEQGNYWEYHDYLFEHQSGENEGAFSRPHLKEFAVKLGLNEDSFSQCLEKERYANIIRADEQIARRLGLRGVPSILVNGRLIHFEEWDEILPAIDEAL
jgi:protein-disulfide isomerase